MVRHTLLLREQLLPFNIRFTAVERMLDFSSTTTALSKMVANSRALLRLDPTNALLKFAKEGLPRLEQTQVDGKRKMDESVRLACAQLTSSNGTQTRLLTRRAAEERRSFAIAPYYDCGRQIQFHLAVDSFNTASVIVRGRKRIELTLFGLLIAIYGCAIFRSAPRSRMDRTMAPVAVR